MSTNTSSSNSDSSKKLSILQFGCTASIVHPNSDALTNLGIDSKGVVVYDGPGSYSEIAKIVASQKWDGLFVGYGVRGNKKWFDKVMKTVHAANPSVPLLSHNGPNDLKNAIERNFNIKLRKQNA